MYIISSTGNQPSLCHTCYRFLRSNLMGFEICVFHYECNFVRVEQTVIGTDELCEFPMSAAVMVGLMNGCAVRLSGSSDVLIV